MNKKVLIGLLIIFVCVLFLILKNIHKNDSKTIEFTYKTNGGVPYNWEYEIEDESIVGFVKSYEIANENKGGKVGAPIYTNYVFKGLKPGKTTVTFRYVYIDGRSVSTEEKLILKVDNSLNISLVTLEKD